jgi:hypothetical protein
MRQLLAGVPSAQAERALRTQGAPLPDCVRDELEDRFDEDLGHVRLHSGGAAATAAEATGARAFTYGSDVVFGAGQYNVASSDGRRLLAHEVAHVVQQTRGGAVGARADHAAVERGGERAAEAVMHGAGPVTVEGSSPRAIARDAKVPESTLPRVEVVDTGPSSHAFKVDGITLIEYSTAEGVAEQRVDFGIKREGKKLLIGARGGYANNLRLSAGGAEALAARGYDLQIQIEQEDRQLGERSIDVERPFIPVVAPPPKLRQPIRINAETRSEVEPLQVDPANRDPGAIRDQATPAEATKPPAGHNAELDAVFQQMPAELAEVEPLVAKLVADATANPKDHALNEYRYLDARLEADLGYLRDLLPFAGERSKEVEDAIKRLEELRKQLAPALATATKWHEDNPAGQSLGMWNEEVAVDLLTAADKFEAQGNFGKALDYRTAALGIAFLDAAESMLALGFHETATAVSQAYTAGDLSWNEGEKLLAESADRAIVIAVVTRGAGALFSRLGAATATALRIAPTATRFAIVAGGIEGGLTAAAALTTQALYTKILSGAFRSPQAQAIWNRGTPSGLEWAIAIPLSIVLGSAGAVNALNKANAKLVGQVVRTPAGEMEIVSVVGDRIVLKPKGSTLVPPEPPAVSGAMVYDPATRSWKLQLPEAPKLTTGGQELPVKGQTGDAVSSVAAADESALVSKAPETKLETSVAKEPVSKETPPVASEKPALVSEEQLASLQKPALASQEPVIANEKAPVANETAVSSEPVKVPGEGQVQSIPEPLQSVQAQVTPVAKPAPKVRAASQKAATRLSAADESLATAQKTAQQAAEKVKAAKQELLDAEEVSASYGNPKEGKKLVKDNAKLLKKAEAELKLAQANEKIALREREQAANASQRIAELEDTIADLEAQMAAELDPPELPIGRSRYQIPPTSAKPAIKDGLPYHDLKAARDKAVAELAANTKNLLKSLAARSAAATPGKAGMIKAVANAEKLGGALKPVDGVPIDVTTGQPMKPTDRVRADHIESRTEITNDPRMARLSPPQQDYMWHEIQENFLPLTEAANSSKGGLSVAEWIAARQRNGQPLPKEMAKALLEADAAARQAIDDAFSIFLGL